jgi:hypothetical protein
VPSAYYHVIILDLFRPFLDLSDETRLRSFSSPDSTPQTVFEASFRQLQRFLVEYCTKCDPRFYNFFLNGAVLHVNHILLHDTKIPGWQFYLQLCMGWMKAIFVRYAVIGKVAQAHMAIGLEKGIITAGEARSFLADLQQLGRHHDLAEIGLSCVVDFSTAMSSENDGRAQELAQRFDELALFDELTLGDL